MQPTEELNSPTPQNRFELAPQPDPDTTAWRIIHDVSRRSGEELWVDHFAGRWLVQTESKTFPRSLLESADGLATSVYWRPRDKAAATAPEWVWGERVEESFLVTESGASFQIDFSSGYSSGIFLDQRLNRKRVRSSVSAGQRILNTFAYTGAFSVMASLSGATTTTVDLSRTYLDWTWENFRANGLDPDEHYGVRGDTFEWLRVFQKKGRTFHGIILDPPTFSRSGKKTFRTDQDYAFLVKEAASLLEPGGWLLCCANTHRLSASQFQRDVIRGVGEAQRNVASHEALTMPSEFHGDEYLKSLWVVVS